jgi:hypothetical protein
LASAMLHKKKNEYIYTRFNDSYQKFEFRWTENLSYKNLKSSNFGNLTSGRAANTTTNQENDINNSNRDESQLSQSVKDKTG